MVETEAALGVVTSRFFYRVASMPKKKSGFNPFYVLLVLLGIAFTVTACAYGVMAFKATRSDDALAGAPSGAAMLTYLDQHGGELMALELALLAVCTFAAMSTDRYWIRRDADERRRAGEVQERQDRANS